MVVVPMLTFPSVEALSISYMVLLHMLTTEEVERFIMEDLLSDDVFLTTSNTGSVDTVDIK